MFNALRRLFTHRPVADQRIGVLPDKPWPRLPPVDLDPPHAAFVNSELSEHQKRLIARTARRLKPILNSEVARLNRQDAPPLPNTTHRPLRSGMDIDRTGSAARKPKSRKHKTTAKKKCGVGR